MTPSPIKKVASIHDLSCIGRCSLTVILPILSCLGIQACPLPTAVLSTHPGGFADVVFHDCTPQIAPFAAHWRREAVEFDAIYSGFLASEQQVGLIARFIDDFSANRPLVLVDPVMGDDGQLYSICTAAMKEQILSLVQKAGIITPTKVERTALQNAAEVAILLLTTDCIVVEAPKKEAGGAGHGHDHGGGMGGMDDMM